MRRISFGNKKLKNRQTARHLSSISRDGFVTDLSTDGCLDPVNRECALAYRSTELSRLGGLL